MNAFGTEMFVMQDEEGGDDLRGHSSAANFAFCVLVRSALRISVLAENAASNLRELNGCEVDRPRMIELFNMVEELAAFNRRHLDELRAALNVATTGAAA